MKNIHAMVQRVMVAFFVIFFALVSTYVPQTWNKVEYAEAGAMTGGATEPTQILNNIQLLAVNLATTASAAFDKITSWATNNLYFKEYVLDGIAWSIAKMVISQMTSSIVKWINSGFKGSPAFVQDMKLFLTDIADKAIGGYLEELDGPLSFLCSPFKLDVRIALAVSYMRSREGQPAASSCTLTGVLTNIENFVDGDFTKGGWESWFAITSKPETYTPYGSILTAQSQASINILNDKNNQTNVLGFGGGFLSTKVCQIVGTPTTSSGKKESCQIVTPGKVTQEALNFHLSSGTRSLLNADEINEIIAALFGQLAKQVVTGASGLLGLSGGGGGGGGSSYVDSLVSTSNIDILNLTKVVGHALAEEKRFLSATIAAKTNLTLYIATATDTNRKNLAIAELSKIHALQVDIGYKIPPLQGVYNILTTTPPPDAAKIQSATQYFSTLEFHSSGEIDAAIQNWQKLVN